MPETALLVTALAGTDPTVPVRQPVTETEATIIIGPWRAVTNECEIPAGLSVAAETPGWLSAEAYEAMLAGLIAETSGGPDAPWEPDTPEQTADRREITEALLEEQLGVITRDQD